MKECALIIMIRQSVTPTRIDSSSAQVVDKEISIDWGSERI